MADENRLFRVRVEEIDPVTKETVRVIDEDIHKSIMLLTEELDGNMCEFMANISLVEMAAMLASGRKTRIAIKLASAIEKAKRDMVNDDEDELINSILGGMSE